VKSTALNITLKIDIGSGHLSFITALNFKIKKIPEGTELLDLQGYLFISFPWESFG